MRFRPLSLARLAHRLVDVLQRRSVSSWVARQARLQLIQVGANDGVMADPIREIVLRPNVHAVLVEPVPDVFARLAQTYALQSRVVCRQVAVVPDDDRLSVPFFRFVPKPGAHWDELYTGWGSTRRDHLEKFREFVPDFDSLVQMESVPATTLAKLFASTGWSTIDMLQMDVEGLDVALMESMPFDSWVPRIIRFEHIHSDRDRLLRLLSRLHAIGYRTFSHGFDTLCIRVEEMPHFRMLSLIQRLHPAWFVPPR